MLVVCVRPHDAADRPLRGLPSRATDVVVVGTVVAVVFSLRHFDRAGLYRAALNKYKPLTDTTISEPILAMARANQIPVTQVFEVDASRQSNRVSANAPLSAPPGSR